MEKIKDKIEKLLRQTVDNGATESEAQSALLLARKLMLKYKINEKDVINNHNDDVYQLELNYDFEIDNVWPRQLLTIFIKNCGIFNYVKTNGNKMKYILFGFKVDVECVEVLFNCAYEYILSQANKNYNDFVELFGSEYAINNSIKDCYVQGFLSGLEYKYEEQNKSNKNFELMIVPDKKVKDEFEKFTNNFNKVNITNDIKIKNESEMILKGFNDGKNFGTTPLNNGNLKLSNLN